MKRAQVFSFTEGEFSVVDTLHGEEIVAVEDEEFAARLADAANLFFESSWADRVRALRARSERRLHVGDEGAAARA